MKVLWFSGVELPAVSGSKLKRGGWIEGYRAALEEFHPEFDLAIASYSTNSNKTIRKGNAIYFPIHRQSRENKWQEALQKWKHDPIVERETEQYLDLITKVNPDLIHIHGTENPFGLVLEKCHVPAVISLQANVSRCNKELFTDFAIENYFHSFFSREFIKGDGILHKRMTWNKYQNTEKSILQGCPNIIGRTDWDRNLAREVNRAVNYFHCDEILENEYYSHEWKEPKEKGFTVFCTSSNAFFKGAVTLVKAVNLAISLGHEINLLLAGVDQESEVGRTIGKIISKGQGGTGIKLLGRLMPAEIISKMQSSNCFVLPTHMDNSPNSLCEAMLIGMPCIASNVGGIPSLIDEGKTGFLFNDKDPSELTKKIIWMKQNPEKAMELGKAARTVALRRHDRKKVADQLVEIYTKIVNNSTN